MAKTRAKSSRNEIQDASVPNPFAGIPFIDDLFSYQYDAWQRGVLYLDVMRRREEQSRLHSAKTVPHVLQYDAELLIDGRTLERPVNYLLVRILPPEDTSADPLKRPFVIVDPRAGHGPGIGGFKADSEIGVAMKAGHPCYFIGFLPEPEPGQTIEDIGRAEAVFLETVIARHPEAEGLPCVIGNCQAGWAVMMVAALRPELFGPIVVAGTPLSYWAGVKGQYPMRYSGGLVGGSWLTALAGDIGNGKFDGAMLVQNFENQNPANTLWSKQYNLYSRIDDEAERYLGFEKWWGSHVTLNAEEMQFIVDELFVGNKLASGEIKTSDGTAIDLRNIRSPIVVFCSKGDNITPPQQALDWILDLYDSVEDIRACGQTIVYAIHETIGHLGIFVSASVAKKEHDEFASNIDFIDVLPPGLYEAQFSPVGEATDNPDLVSGDWLMRCRERTLDDIRALGANSLEEERQFETVARLSEINLALYRTFIQPFVKATVTPQIAEFARQSNPLRIQYQAFGDATPFLGRIEEEAQGVRTRRAPAAPDNMLIQFQQAASNAIVEVLDTFRDATEKISEETFRAIYSNPLLQAALGVDSRSQERPRKSAKNPLHEELLTKRITEIKQAMDKGGLREAVIRSMLYVGRVRDSVDERSFEAIKQIRAGLPSANRLTLMQFKQLVRDQFFMLLVDEEAAIKALPSLLSDAGDERDTTMELLIRVLEARGPLEEPAKARLREIAACFKAGKEPGSLTLVTTDHGKASA